MTSSRPISSLPGRVGPLTGEAHTHETKREGLARKPSRSAAAEEYVGLVGAKSRAAFAVVLGRNVPIPRGAIVGPVFHAEAGKRFSLVLDTDKCEELRRLKAVRVEMRCSIDDSPTELRSVMADGARDLRTGSLIFLPGKVQIPSDARGLLRVTLDVTDAEGKVRHEGLSGFDAQITPAVGATLSFNEDWGVEVQGVLRGGDRLALDYDVRRMRKLLGAPEARVTAYVSFDGAPALERQLVDREAGGVEETPYLPAVVVPLRTSQVKIWFGATGGDKTEWDSKFGRDFVFDVAAPRANRNPRFKETVLESQSFPLLTPENFEVILPADPTFNCIAWSVGNSREWVWPGSTVEAFDAFYAERGFRPCEGCDLSQVLGVEKIALYGSPDWLSSSSEIVVRHAARMDVDGSWTSKLAEGALIRHQDPGVVAGSANGRVVRVYERPMRQP